MNEQMTTDKKRAILEAAAKACGYVFTFDFDNDLTGPCIIDNEGFPRQWDTIDNSSDAASMCIRLDINTFFYLTIKKVECSAEDAGNEQVIRYTVGHNGTPEGKEAAWRLAASMVGAKVGGYSE